MSKRKRMILGVAGTIALLLIGVILGPYVQIGEIGYNEPKTNPKFVISSWSYPDAYGQGIEDIELEDNSTGGWTPCLPDATRSSSDSTIWNITAGYGLRLTIFSWLNKTFTGATDLVDGRNYLRHSVSVALTNGTVVFSQQNFTYVGSYGSGSLIYYEYRVILNFLPVWSMTYTATVDYQIYYESSWMLDPSPQSITSFSETLPDNEMFCPDDSNFLAVSGNATSVTGGTYASTQAVDNVSYYTAWTVTGDSHTDIFQLNFTTSYFNLIDIHYYFRRYTGTGTFDEGGIQLFNHTSGAWEYVYSDTDWQASMTNRSISIVSSDFIAPDGNVWLRVLLTMTDGGSGTDWGLFIDYCSLTASYGSGYVESFTDVSDWSGYTTEAGDTMTTDGDVATITYHDDNNADYWQTDIADAVLTGKYIEIRSKYNTTAFGSKCSLLLVKGGLIGAGGSTSQSVTIAAVSGWTTGKTLITSTDTITALAFYMGDAAAGYEVAFDYLRIEPANESGWQQDGGSTVGISSSDGGTISSDGGNITLTADGDGSSFLFVVDTTTNASALSCTYYSFFALSIIDGFGLWSLEQYDGSAYATLQSQEIIPTGIQRFNMKSLDSYVYWWRLNLTAGSSLTEDFAKAYSIANWTYTGSGVSTDDYLYVSSSVLYCSGTSFTSIVLDRDPALSVDTNTYTLWNISTSSGIPQTDYYIGAWAGYSSETEGSLAAGTLTDVRVKFTDSADMAAIRFLENVTFSDWNDVVEVQLYFVAPFSPETYWVLNSWYMLFGMGLVIGSAMFLAVKVKNRDDMSNAFYFFVVAEMIGWALIVGSVLP